MTGRDLLGETEQFLHQQIPLSRAMGVNVEGYDGKQLVLTAPLPLNHNHLGTAFGGSLSAIATLAGYALLWLELDDRECHIVISKSSISFRRPVEGIIRAVCHRPGDAALAGFKKKFALKGKAQIRLTVTIGEEGRTAVDFEGIYVAKK
ncbi:MAG: YiiD C-terminal domain-containing protein [Chthoniobacteraceae bacterium]